MGTINPSPHGGLLTAISRIITTVKLGEGVEVNQGMLSMSWQSPSKGSYLPTFRDPKRGQSPTPPEYRNSTMEDTNSQDAEDAGRPGIDQDSVGSWGE